jgi:hypothetical protein
MVTGKLSGVLVVDIDDPESLHGFSSNTVVKTISGGHHLWFKYRGGVRNTVRVGTKPVDVRGEGGFVVVPPSGEGEHKYEWVSYGEKLPDFPDIPAEQVTRVANKLDGVEEGQRNETAASVVGKLLKRFPHKEWETEAWKFFKAWNSGNIPPLPETELRIVFDSIAGREKKNNDDSGNSGGKRVVADRLVDFVTESGAELYLDQNDEPHITFPDKPVVGFSIKSPTFRRWLASKYWQEEGKGFSGESLLRAVGSLEGKAFHEGTVVNLFNRVAKHENNIYYDLGDDKRVVEVSSSGWAVKSSCPFRFRRFNHQVPQVTPINGGKLEEVLKFVNLKSETDKLLFLTYLVAVLIPDIPRVVLINIGDQGAAKSTAMRIIRSMVDPSQSELLSPPNDIGELAQASNHHYCLYLDNLTYLRDEFSDVLCRLVTGIGFSKRKLFTDNEDILFNQKAAVGISGINLVAQRADLLDRCLILSYERIPDEKRMDEEDFWKRFDVEKPRILGALFTTLSHTLANISEIKLVKKPRMADYAKYAAASAIALESNPEDFLEAFGTNITRQNRAAIESSSTAQAIMKFMVGKEEWSGSSSDLHVELSVIVEKMRLELGGSDGFPKSSSWLWRKIMPIRPNLLSVGIQVVRSESGEGSLITISKHSMVSENTAIVASVGGESVAAVAASQTQLEDVSSAPVVDEGRDTYFDMASSVFNS